METTIQISDELRQTLQVRKLSDKESYERVIWDLIEDSLEISEQTKKDLSEARAQVKKEKIKTLAQVKKEMGF